ncbi:hypothetical protein Hanom_Chr09g00796681 [Helianthus anomalus]
MSSRNRMVFRCPPICLMLDDALFTGDNVTSISNVDGSSKKASSCEVKRR